MKYDFNNLHELRREFDEGTRTEPIRIWACCFCWREYNKRFIRNVQPIELYLKPRVDTRSWHHGMCTVLNPNDIMEFPISTNAHGSELVMFDNYQECVEYYNNEIRRTIEYLSHIKTLDDEKFIRHTQRAERSMVNN